MPKFDFKPGDEAYIVQKDKYELEGPYRVTTICKVGANGPQTLILEGDTGTITHADPKTVFHDRETARLFALDLVNRAIAKAENDLKALTDERFLLSKNAKYSIGQTVWAFVRRQVKGPFVIEKAYPLDYGVSYLLKSDSILRTTEFEEVLYPTKEEAKAAAIKAAAERVAEAQKALDEAKAEEKAIIDE